MHTKDTCLVILRLFLLLKKGISIKTIQLAFLLLSPDPVEYERITFVKPFELKGYKCFDLSLTLFLLVKEFMTLLEQNFIQKSINKFV